MQVHGNSKLVPSLRLLLVRRVLEQRWKIADAAAAFGISERTAYRWLARWRAGDQALLARPDRVYVPAGNLHRRPSWHNRRGTSSAAAPRACQGARIPKRSPPGNVRLWGWHGARRPLKRDPPSAQSAPP